MAFAQEGAGTAGNRCVMLQPIGHRGRSMAPMCAVWRLLMASWVCACAGPGGRQPAARCSGQARFEGYQIQESHPPTCYAGVPRLYLPASWLVDHGVWSVIFEVLHCAQDRSLVIGNVHVSTPNGYMKLVCVCVCVWCGVADIRVVVVCSLRLPFVVFTPRPACRR